MKVPQVVTEHHQTLAHLQKAAAAAALPVRVQQQQLLLLVMVVRELLPTLQVHAWYLAAAAAVQIQPEMVF
jgi:hypothetical protein